MSHSRLSPQGKKFPTALACLAIVLAAATLAYWPGLSGPLLYDDVHALADLRKWIAGQVHWQKVVFSNESGLLGRSVSMASFVAVAAWAHDDVWMQKLFNVALHLANGVLVFFLLRQFTRLKALVASHQLPSDAWALLGASIWLLHPLLVSTVLYLVQRMTQLSACFALLAMLSFVHGRCAYRTGHTRRGLFLLAMALPIATGLSVFSKENGILVIPLCGLIELFVFKPEQSRRTLLSRVFIGLTLVAPFILILVLTVCGFEGIVGGYGNRPFTLQERVLTQTRVLWSYLGSIAFPQGPKLGLYHDDFPLSKSLLDPVSTALACLGLLGLGATAFALRKRAPGFGLGLGIFLIGHSMESSVLPLLIYFEHRNYLPAVGAIWMLLSLAALVTQHLSRPVARFTSLQWGSGLALVLALAMATWARAGIWSSRDLLLEQGLRSHPGSRMLRIDLFDRALVRADHRDSGDDARVHAAYLQASAEESTRRLGHALELMLDCKLRTPRDRAKLDAVFQGVAKTMEADLTATLENLALGSRRLDCPAAQPGDLAPRLAGMLDRTSLPMDDRAVWRLRFEAASLYLFLKMYEHAEQQALLAYRSGVSQPPVGLMLAQLKIRRGDLQGAAAIIRPLQAQVRAMDQRARAQLESTLVALRASGFREPLHD